MREIKTTKAWVEDNHLKHEWHAKTIDPQQTTARKSTYHGSTNNRTKEDQNQKNEKKRERVREG